MSKRLSKIKAIEIINTFSSAEKSEFRKFLSSPYFNSNGNLIKLYSVLLSNELKIKSDEITEKEIYAKIFNKEAYSYSSMRNLMSALFQLCEEFLIVNAGKKNDSYKFENILKLLKEYNDRYLDKNYYIRFKKTYNDLDYKFLGYKYFEYKSRLNYSLSNFEWLRNNSDKRKDSLYEECLNSICSVISTISENIAIHHYSKLAYNYKPELKPSESLIKNLDLKKFLEELKTLDDLRYYHISNELRFINLILQPDNYENYYILKKEIFKNVRRYSNSEKSYHFSRLISFLINQIHNGNNKLVREVSEFRKFQMANIKYGSDGVDKLSMRNFLDMVDTFLITESDKFIESFIRKNLSKVETINSENAYNYAFARLELKKKNFEKAIEHLSRLKLTEDFMKFQSKMLIIQAFYEIGNFESGLYALDSLKHFMKSNNSINSSLKTNLNEIIRITEKIYKINSKPENYSMFDLEKTLSNIRNISSSNITWYEMKIELLKKHYSTKGRLSRTA